MEVGKYYKKPILPIWIICKEYHYTVVFSKSFKVIEPQVNKFDLIFYDELYNKHDYILLTLDVGHGRSDGKSSS